MACLFPQYLVDDCQLTIIPDADDFDRPMSLRVSVEELAHTSLGD